jgi:hypothetical protein
MEKKGERLNLIEVLNRLLNRPAKLLGARGPVDGEEKVGEEEFMFENPKSEIGEWKVV